MVADITDDPDSTFEPIKQAECSGLTPIVAGEKIFSVGIAKTDRTNVYTLIVSRLRWFDKVREAGARGTHVPPHIH